MSDTDRPKERTASHDALAARASELREAARRLTARALELRAETVTLQERLGRMSNLNSSLIAELRTSVQDYAAALRALGETPERTIIEVKQIAAEAGRDAEAQSPRQRLDHDGVREDIVRWATQAYFSS